ETVTFVAPAGPLSVTVSVYENCAPIVSGPPGAVFTTERSAASALVTTAVVAAALLVAGCGAAWFALTVAGCEIEPGEVGGTTSVIVRVAPARSSPMVHVTVPEAWLQLPWLLKADWKITPAGNWSTTVTPVAGLGPALAAVSVYANGLASTTVVGAVVA